LAVQSSQFDKVLLYVMSGTGDTIAATINRKSVLNTWPALKRTLINIKGNLMKPARICLILEMVLLALCFAVPSIASEEKEMAAVAAAQAWLTLVDEGNYGESWETAAPYFQNAIPKEQWEQMLIAVRTPLGSLVSREPLNSAYTQSLPGAPDGEYVVIQFKASFINKKSAVETVTPMLGSDGSWRVSGYYIK
jgi:hypothetical protein